ncbi:MAG: hypothetical protein R3324_15385, partial [Halobacteriales archaeon]|nr:hypothetical protein [Halobacteriales archaeon]
MDCSRCDRALDDAVPGGFPEALPPLAEELPEDLLPPALDEPGGEGAEETALLVREEGLRLRAEAVDDLGSARAFPP